MAPVPSSASSLVFRSGAAPWLTGFLVVLGAVIAGLGLGGGAASAVASVLVGAAVAHLGWYLYWRPHVRVGPEGVRVVNPLRTVVVPWGALVDVRNRFALTLVTRERSVTCFALPAGGARAALRGAPGDLTGTHPSARPDGTVRSGDLLSTRGGAAADAIRRRWQAMVEDGTLDVFADRDPEDDAVRTELRPAPTLVLLVLGALAAAAVLAG
ncbi:PH domain-containing protein [Kocuria sp. U4B]|jgi:hypothetical protein